MHGGIPTFVHMWASLGRIYSEKGFLFPVSFFLTRNGVPSLPGDGWGGDGGVACVRCYTTESYRLLLLLLLLVVVDVASAVN